MIFGSWSRRRASACFSGEAECSSGGTASALGRLPFRRCGRVVPGPGEPVGVTPSEPGGRLHGIGDRGEALCAPAVHVGGGGSYPGTGALRRRWGANVRRLTALIPLGSCP